jgi:hypothetical protein
MPPKKKARLSETPRAVARRAEKAQEARDKIRDLITKLPDAEAAAIEEIIDDAEYYEEPGVRFPWDKLPAEVKNMIFRYLFVSTRPVRPHVYFPGVAHRRRIEKFSLGANFLRCSKSIHDQGLPILLSENVSTVDR